MLWAHADPTSGGDRTGTPDGPILLADVGGTNVRMQVRGADGTIMATDTRTAADHPDVASALQAFLAHAAVRRGPSTVAMSVAGPVLDDEIRLTNSPWRFRLTELGEAMGAWRVLGVNDFVAQARAVPQLGPESLDPVGGPAAGHPDQPVAVLGPGTGLGVGLLVPDGGRWRPVPSEGGHVTMAAASPEEAALLDVLRPRYGHVSAERVISGPGLVALYHAHRVCAGRATEGDPDMALAPADVVARAERGADVEADSAIRTLLAMLGTVAGNLALTVGAFGGVYLAGGLMARPPLAARIGAAGLYARFLDKGRHRRLLEMMPLWRVTRATSAFDGLAALVADDDAARSDTGPARPDGGR